MEGPKFEKPAKQESSPEELRDKELIEAQEEAVKKAESIYKDIRLKNPVPETRDFGYTYEKYRKADDKRMEALKNKVSELGKDESRFMEYLLLKGGFESGQGYTYENAKPRENIVGSAMVDGLESVEGIKKFLTKEQIEKMGRQLDRVADETEAMIQKELQESQEKGQKLTYEELVEKHKHNPIRKTALERRAKQETS